MFGGTMWTRITAFIKRHKTWIGSALAVTAIAGGVTTALVIGLSSSSSSSSSSSPSPSPSPSPLPESPLPESPLPESPLPESPLPESPLPSVLFESPSSLEEELPSSLFESPSSVLFESPSSVLFESPLLLNELFAPAPAPAPVPATFERALAAAAPNKKCGRFRVSVIRCPDDGAIYQVAHGGLYWFSPEAYAIAGFPRYKNVKCAAIARCEVLGVLRGPVESPVVTAIVVPPEPVVVVPPEPVVVVPPPVVVDGNARVTYYNPSNNDPPGTRNCAFIPQCVSWHQSRPSSAAVQRGSPLYGVGKTYTVAGAGMAPFCVRIDDICAGCHGTHIDIFLEDGERLPFDYAVVTEGC